MDKTIGDISIYSYNGALFHAKIWQNFTYLHLPVLFSATLLDGGTFATFEGGTLRMVESGPLS